MPENQNQMDLMDALVLLARTHLKNIDDDAWWVNAPTNLDGVWVREDEYVLAWATLREAVMFRRRLIEELDYPGYAIIERLSPEIREKISEVLRPNLEVTIRPSKGILSQALDIVRYGAKSPKDVIEALLSVLLSQGQMLDSVYKNSIDHASLTPLIIRVPKDGPAKPE